VDAEDVGFTRLEELDGLITPDVGRVLYDYAKRVPADQAIIELGSYHGKSTAYLAMGASDGNGHIIYAIDTWSEDHSAWRRSVMDRIPSPSMDTFVTQLESVGLADQVDPVKSTTADAAADYVAAVNDGDMPRVGLLFIDADHNFDAVWNDFHAWRPALADDGFIIFDDYTKNNPGVVKTVRKLRAEGWIEPVTREAGAGRLVITTLTKKAYDAS